MALFAGLVCPSLLSGCDGDVGQGWFSYGWWDRSGLEGVLGGRDGFVRSAKAKSRVFLGSEAECLFVGGWFGTVRTVLLPLV